MKDFYENTRKCIDRYNQIMENLVTRDSESTDEEDEFIGNFCIHFAHALIADTGFGGAARDELCRITDIIDDVVR